MVIFGPIKNGKVIKKINASIDSRNPNTLINNRDFWSFLQLCIFGHHFIHGNEWVHQGILDGIGNDIYKINIYSWYLLLKIKFDWKKISYFTKSLLFNAILRQNDINLVRILFNSFLKSKDFIGIQLNLMYWSQ